ncbi:choline dehydrogenase [[Emmonsia] crescens]|uniref:Choline dehydrogenase n=1 Tax=[Emmonsia] crescens TaxID=73230 RepID=A0A0G2J0K1_9EURO|nr:choline dehydrogenase [Emmonsia crescens UAMH 3008]
MATTDHISAVDVNNYDYVIVGGGTAGCVIASRLAEYLPRMKILVIEAGPSDYQDDRILLLKDWLSLLGSQEFDYDYGTVEQPMGNSYIRHSRAKVLGGCSSHNTLISFRTFEYDCKLWESMGCKGWDFETFTRLADNLRNTIQPVHLRHRNQLCKDWVESCSTALKIPVVEDFNKEIREKGKLTECVGFFSISYNPEDGRRSSASVAYIHPIISGDEKRPNLTILTNAWVSRVNVKDDTVTGVSLTLKSGEKLTVNAKRETILCAGSVDTPRLLLLSGIGPQKQLSSLSIPVVKDIPGVGENLLDHPETIIIWELNRPVPPNQTTMDSDAGIFLRREAPNAAGFDGDAADVMMHCYQIPFCREVAPGPNLTTDEELSEYGRRVAHTVYHPAGTTKMGDVLNDPYAVVDSQLKIRGLKKVRIADAGVFPTMPTANPMVTVLTIAERAAELIAEEAGWRREAPRL